MSGAHILLVDDDSALLQALPEALRLSMDGITVDTADSAGTALERVAGTDYDAIVSDIKMPGMDGLELLAEIRSRCPETPTLMITGHGEHDLAIRALRGGAYDFIQKPIDRAYFVAALNRAIQMRLLSRQVKEQKLALERHASDLERTVEERTRELREASQAKDRILAVFSHELRAPLTPILAWAQILRREPDLRRVRQAADVIERNVRMQTTLVDDLLDLARVTEGTIALDLRAQDLRDIIRTALESIADIAFQKGIRLEHTLCDEPVPVEADVARLHQVFANLLWNAVKFTPRNGRITVTLTRERDTAVTKVQDSGAGIAADFLPMVFRLFGQPEERTDRKHQGPGLGLALARHLAELHGGTIEAASGGIGSGAEFTVRLPVRHRAPGTSPAPTRDTGGRLPSLKSSTILLVEDLADTSEATQAILETLGARVVLATDGLEALNVLAKREPDLILCDLRLPVMDGFEFVQRLRADPRRAHLPVIAFSALAKPNNYRDIRAAGFDMHISKPFDYAVLAHAVHTLIHGRRLPQAS